mgnify:CR=1 FL=1
MDENFLLEKERSQREIKFLVSQMKLNMKDKILDVGCGQGRLTNRLSSLGYNVTGIDMDKNAIEIAKEYAKIHYLKTKYMDFDIRNSYLFEIKFNKIFLLYCYFNYKEDKQVLLNIYNNLDSNGLLCFDLMNFNYKFEKFIPYNENALISEKNITSFQTINFEKRKKFGNAEISEIVYDVFSVSSKFEDISDILRNIGFKLIRVYSDWDFKRFLKFKS